MHHTNENPKMRKASPLSLISLFAGLLITVQPASLLAAKIVWDQSHTPLATYTVDGRYAGVASRWRNLNHQVTSNTQSLEARGLLDVDLLVVSVLSNYETAFSAAEATRVAHYVNSGGGLLVLADNSGARPANLARVLGQFGVTSGADDRITPILQFANHALNDSLRSISLFNGSALTVDNRLGLSSVGTDSVGLIGLVAGAVGGGRVLVVGDANVLTDDLLGAGDNARLARNAAGWLARTSTGRIQLPETNREVYLVIGTQSTWDLRIGNRGDGRLGYELTGGTAAFSPATTYGIVLPQSDSTARFTLSAGQSPDSILQRSVTLRHSDPTADPIVIRATIHTLPDRPVHFRVPGPTGVDHSLLVTGVTRDNRAVDAGVEVGAFMPDGSCAGAAVFVNGSAGFSAKGDDPATPAVDGFRDEEPFEFRLYFPWSQEETAALPSFGQGPDVFRTDGFTTLTLAARPSARLTLNLGSRWNQVSMNLVPIVRRVEEIFAPFVEAGNLVLVKDGDGRFWDVRTGFNNLGDWDVRRGYQVKLRQAAALDLTGSGVDIATAIPLRAGWNLVSYLPSRPNGIDSALANLGDNLLIVKRGDGAFWSRRWNWDGIGAMEPGQGYFIRVAQRADLIYREAPRRNVRGAAMRMALSDRSMNLLILAEPNARVQIQTDQIVSEGILDATGKLGLVVWGGSESGLASSFVQDGYPLTISVNGTPATMAWLEGEPKFADGAFAVGRVEELPSVVELSAIAHPNPFNNRFDLHIEGAVGDASVAIFDQSGRQVSGKVLLDIHASSPLSIDASSLPAGIFFARVSDGARYTTIKLVHLP